MHQMWVPHGQAKNHEKSADHLDRFSKLDLHAVAMCITCLPLDSALPGSNSQDSLMAVLWASTALAIHNIRSIFS